jgi:legumain
MIRACIALLALAAVAAAVPAFDLTAPVEGTRWALLIAGSNTWGNYRHQADIYHAYQIMKAGGLDDEHIVVMHYDDIANSSENPKKGTVINSPTGSDVYHGVPKDYTGADLNAANFLAVLAGDKTKVKGGSGKVIASGPQDKVFVYYADHGGPGILGMPDGETYLYGKDIVSTLEAKAAAKGFAQLVFYLEACESGSIFEGTLPANIKVYATTAANAEESSWGCYCPGQTEGPPAGYNTCLGDLYSVAWMENTDAVGRKETFENQFELVKNRVSQNGTFSQGSHVMQYGELDFDGEDIDLFIGDVKANANAALPTFHNAGVVSNRDANLVYLGLRHPARLIETLARRAKIDAHMLALATRLTASKAHHVMNTVAHGVTEDWTCFKANMEAFHSQCGALGDYGMKYSKVMANLCNEGVSAAEAKAAMAEICA